MIPRRLGFLVNPVAGLGGRVGLKGTDGLVAEAVAKGAAPVAPGRAQEFLDHLLPSLGGVGVKWYTASGSMGGDLLPAAKVVHRPKTKRTTATDTIRTVEAFLREGVEAVVFVGGDGTARDVLGVVEARVAMVGVPAGVKMYSAVFATSPSAAAKLLQIWLREGLEVGEAEVLDIDEEAYRRGEWRVRLEGTALTPQEPSLVQRGKDLADPAPEAEHLEALATHLKEMMASEPDSLFLVGPGGTLRGVASIIGLPKSLLGVDAWAGGKAVALDLDEAGILDLLCQYPGRRLVVSPIGAQGFVLGRGNLQLSPEVLRRVGSSSLVVVATPSKLDRTPLLRVDTGDPRLDLELRRRRYLPVLVAYHTQRLHPLE